MEKHPIAYKLGMVVGSIICLLFAVAMVVGVVVFWRWILGFVGIIVLLLLILEFLPTQKGGNE